MDCGRAILLRLLASLVLIQLAFPVLADDTELACEQALASQGRPCEDDWIFKRQCNGQSPSSYSCDIETLTAEATMVALGAGILILVSLLLCCKRCMLKRRSDAIRKEYANAKASLAKSSSMDSVAVVTEKTEESEDEDKDSPVHQAQSPRKPHPLFALQKLPASQFQKPTPEDKEIEFSVSVLSEEPDLVDLADNRSDDGNVANSTTSEDKDPEDEIAIDFSVTDITIDEHTVIEAEHSLAQLRAMMIPEDQEVDGPDLFDLGEIVCENSRDFSPTKTMHSGRRLKADLDDSPQSPDGRFSQRSKSQNDLPSGSSYTLPPNMSRTRSIERSQAIKLTRPDRRSRYALPRRYRPRPAPVATTTAPRPARGSLGDVSGSLRRPWK